MPPEDVSRFTDKQFVTDGPQHHVLKTGGNYVCNNIARDFELPEWIEWARIPAAFYRQRFN